jgi:hypothetical protein
VPLAVPFLWRGGRWWWRFAGVSAAVALGVFAWWTTLRPSNDRHWQPDVAETPWAEIDGDTVTLHNLRNFRFRTPDDFDTAWESRVVNLSDLRGADLALTFWGSPYMCHTIASFDFGSGGRVCFSIETRKEVGESYSAVGGLYRQFELVYVMADERDVLQLRTSVRENEEVYLYPLVKITPEKARALFLDYLETANGLHQQPEWYNAVTTNCTTGIRVHTERTHLAAAWDWRILVNGYLDQLLYERGTIPNSLPFPENKEHYHINVRARAAGDGPGFSEAIRR